ncbi:hypothetical protein Godav_014317 [Gossypium davidsonii]|uniref:GRAM domain-containing protein n=2 Tax=Gossypium TaxID=3633 RepID=A0A7J8RJD7_GOSDV|nr:hypothetical protein [Gossypium davidsonii]MBA0649172.1 hypothetical protein [Gossypium klotzschianum]
MELREEHQGNTYLMLLADTTFHHKGLQKVGKGNFVLKRMNLLGKKADTFGHVVGEHVRLGPKIGETVKGKLSLEARVFLVGGLEKIFKQLFSFREGEKFLKACQCYLSTTTGPIAVLLFISSEKVVVQVEKIKGVNQSENMKKPLQKYMEIVTVDGFDIWFMGFLNYHKAFKCLQQAISQRQDDVDTF